MPEKPAANEDKPPPKCKAILLCESINRENDARRVSLIGLINSQSLAKIPGRTKPMNLYVQLVDGIGEYEVTISVDDLAEDQSIFRAKGGRIAFSNRFLPVRLFSQIPSLPIFHPGRYDVVVFGNGIEIDRQQFSVRQLQSEK
jgi:hypothetical protein